MPENSALDIVTTPQCSAASENNRYCGKRENNTLWMALRTVFEQLNIEICGSEKIKDPSCREPLPDIVFKLVPEITIAAKVR